VLLDSQMIVPGDCGADPGCNHCIQNAFVNPASRVTMFQRSDPVFDESHSPGFPNANEDELLPYGHSRLTVPLPA